MSWPAITWRTTTICWNTRPMSLTPRCCWSRCLKRIEKDVGSRRKRLRPPSPLARTLSLKRLTVLKRVGPCSNRNRSGIRFTPIDSGKSAMTREPSRRHFLRATATAGAALSLGEWGGLLPLTPATAAETKVTPDLLRYSSDIEPIVRLIEETPRAKCPEMMIEQLQGGLPYRQFLAAMFLAGLRNRMLGGHHIALLHSSNQLALDVPVAERLLPTFWALDSFKADVERRRTPRVLNEVAGRLPAAEKAEEELHAAMEALDGDRADRAVVSLVRTQGTMRVIEPMWRYGARDWVFIGHSAIWVANNWRTLQTVGEKHTEPVLRYLVREMIDNAQGVGKEAYAANRERVREALGKLPADWGQGDGNEGFTRELLALVRENKGEDVCRLAVAQLREGKVKAGAVWDAVHLAAGDLALCTRPAAASAQRDTAALHASTVSEALHFAFRSSGEPDHRLLLLLQAVAWLGLFRDRVAPRFGSGILKAKESVLDVTPAEIPERPAAAADEILAARSSNAYEAVGKAFAFARRFPDSDALRRAAARLLPLKATADPHDIKFPVAMFEKYMWVSPEWRPHMAAVAAVAFLGSDKPDSELMTNVREAVRKL